VRGLTAGDGQAYAFTGASSPYKLSVYAAGAFSPTITIDPASQNLTVSSGSETKSVTLHSGATGTPDPTARWQKQLAGASTWGDIPDATSTDLTFDATAANDGDSFRAVYSNAAGEIATTSAQLTVTVDDTLDPVVTIQSPLNGSSTTAASTIVNYTVSDNADSAPECTVANGASVALTLGANTITVSCADDSGNSASATASVTRTAAVSPPDNSVPAPAAPQGKNGKSVKLKYKKGKSARVAVGTVTCASITTCVYTIPASIKFKIGSKSYKAKVVGPKTLEPGKTQTVYATVLDGAIKKLKGKKSKLVVPVQVANSAGKLHSTTMSIISKISA
jgi:hypothetical protein